VKGSMGYKLCRWNEVHALMKKYGTPALFITINPNDISHPLLGFFGNIVPDDWKAMTSYERSAFVASNPGPATRFCDSMLCGFINIILEHGKSEAGLFGHSEVYYGMVE
ncbi:hypothetical protein SERLA73DRAFT_26891, partial [Serpula lacrymans var. lacrymans S7.3]